MTEQLTLDGAAPAIEGGHSGGAEFSPDGVYRWDLHRIWGDGRRMMLWLMLNPSTANHLVLDPTVRRCKGFAERWGFDGLGIRNIFALRSTDPRALYTHPDPVGPSNDWWLAHELDRFELIVCAWGAHGSFMGRGDHVRELLERAGRRPSVLRLTKDGQPNHPLYLPAKLDPIAWTD